MKKKLLFAFLVVVMIFALTLGVLSANNDLSIVIDNREVEFTSNSGEPFIDENGRTQVPLRVVVEQYGCDVEWDGANNCAIITKDGTTVIVPIGKSHILVDGEKVEIDTAAIIKDGRTYLPIRAVLESFGAELEWNNGVVSVKSPATNDFENIYVDEDGNLIFELSNGNKLNVGNIAAADGKDGKNGKDGKDGADGKDGKNGKDGADGKDGVDGKDGKDGVSVVNAYIDSSSNLMIVLSNGNTINAGNVGTGGNMSGLTFADYPVGTKFYLSYPTGEFDVKVSVDGTPYTVHFDSIYYELTAKYDLDDEEAWVYSDGMTKFVPYQIKMYMNGKADLALAGESIQIVLLSIAGEQGWQYHFTIGSDGSFTVNYVQDVSAPWYTPKTLYFQHLRINETYTPPSTGSSEEKIAIEEAIKEVAGTYIAPGNAKKSFAVNDNGTITFDGVDYIMEYRLSYDMSQNLVLKAWCNDYTDDTNYKCIEFYLKNLNAYVIWNGEESWGYKEGSDDAIAVFNLIKNAAGTYVCLESTDKLLTLHDNGIITYNDVDYYPEYTMMKDYGGGNILTVVLKSSSGIFVEYIEFSNVDSETYIAYANKGNSWLRFYREDAFETVTLTKDNFLNYFEYEENFDVICDAWGVLEGVDYTSHYVLKKELGSRLLTASGVAIKYQNDIYTASYSVDLENKKCTVVVGEYIETKSEVIKANATYWPDNIYINYVNHVYGLNLSATTYAKPTIVDAIGTLYLLKN